MEEENCKTQGLKYKHTSDGESTIKAILTTAALMEGAAAAGMEALEDASRKKEVRW
jgi:dihydroxyacetone kinase DhaKLM complex PTS-EIIA-like component DhaM